MMTDKKFDKLMREAADALSMMPEAHNFSHRTAYNGTALTTSWYLEDSKMKELMGPNVGAWGAPNPVEKFVMSCDYIINALVGALKEMADDYDSLEQQYNEYKAMQPYEQAKCLYWDVMNSDATNIKLADILVDHDKAHIKVERAKSQEAVLDTTLEETYQPAHRTLDDWNNSGREEDIAEEQKEQVAAPSEDEAEPVKHGQWEWEPGYVGTEARCSVCKRSPRGFYSLPKSQIGRLPEYPFCPKCGAIMDKKEG